MQTMTPSWRRPLVVIALCVLALGPLVSCSSPAGPITGPCEQTVFSAQSRIPADTYAVQTITMPQTGRLDVTLDWVVTTNIVSLTLAQAPCSVADFHADKCNLLLNLFPPPKPLTGSTFWINAGTYDLLLGNFSPTEEVASTRVVFKTTGCRSTGTSSGRAGLTRDRPRRGPVPPCRRYGTIFVTNPS